MSMFVGRNTDGKIINIASGPMTGVVDEELADDNPELMGYLNPTPGVVDYQTAIQGKVDATAASKQFNDGVTLASYKDSTIPAWSAQAASFIAWRDQVWSYAYTELAKVEAGQRAQPTVSDFLAEMPVMSWPS